MQVAELWSKPAWRDLAWLDLALLGRRRVAEASERNAVDCDVSAGERDGYAAAYLQIWTYPSLWRREQILASRCCII